ncbi:MAG TPA: heme lyase CcmF/NrfE family subunit [Trueperaceae bacterium]
MSLTGGGLSLAVLGGSCVFLALALAVYALVTGVIGAARRDARLQTSARLAAVAVFLAMTAAIFVMEVALLTDDFSVSYVAQHSRIASPTWVKFVTMWAALEGSILLWGWLLSAYTAALAVTAPNTILRPWALAVMQGVQVFFIGVTALAASPFRLLVDPPLDGPGPNPLLQNHWMMAVHPVLMYLGFVGLTVPFAYAMAALITRQPGVTWMTQTRRWTLTGWGFLSAAIVAGGWWSYEVLGWGGFWAWDPVENVSFLPWLTATAFIHSVQVQERRRMLKGWNLLLVTLTFALTILGTFLTRSGVISSVHAFGNGPVGPLFLGFFLLVVLFSFSLVALRWDQVRDRAELDDPVSREGAILLGNILFLAIAFAVLLGTIFPLIVEALTGDKVTVGAPFFDQVSVPVWLIIFLLMGIGPLLPWRKAEEQSLRRNLAWLAGGALAAGLIAFILGMRLVYPLLTVVVAGWNLVSLALLLHGALAPRLRLSDRSALSVFRQYAFESRRRFGSMIVHLAIIVIALGVMGASAYRIDRQMRFQFGEPVAFRGYTLVATDSFRSQTQGRLSTGAVVEVYRNGDKLATLRPRINVFGANQQSAPTPGVYYTPWHDLYLSIAGDVSEGRQSVVLRVVQSPLVAWIWIGGLVLVFGTIWSLLPGRQRVRRRTTNDGTVRA